MISDIKMRIFFFFLQKRTADTVAPTVVHYPKGVFISGGVRHRFFREASGGISTLSEKQ